MQIHAILLLSVVLLVSGEAQTPEQRSPGPLASITQRIARWFWPNKDSNQEQSASNHVRSSQYYSQEKAKQQKSGECSPCNAIPWIPIARAVNSVPATYNENGQHYSFHVPTISLAAVPVVSNQYGPPKSEYGPPKPEYGPPKPEYGPPKPENGPPKPEYGPPKPEYGPPKPEYGPPKPEYGPPKPEYGPPSSPDFGAPPPSEYGPPKSGNGQAKPEYSPPDLSPPPIPEYGPPSSAYGPPKNEYGPPEEEYGPPKPEYGPPKLEYGPPKPEYGPPKPEYGPPKPEYGPPKPEYGPPKNDHFSLDPPSSPDFGPPKPGFRHNIPHDFKPSNLEIGKPKPEYRPPSFKPLNLDFVPPKSGFGHISAEYGFSDQNYQPSTKEHGPNFEYGPPKPEYGPPKPEYGPPKPEYGPPKPEYGPPKPEYGPPKSEYGPPKPDYGPPKPEYGPPKSDYGPPKPYAGPPKNQYGPPKNQYGPPNVGSKPGPQYLPPPLRSYLPPRPLGGPKNIFGPPKNQYGPPKNQYGPPTFNNPPKSHGPPSNNYGPPKGPLEAQSKQKPSAPPNQLRIPGPNPNSQVHDAASNAVSYQTFLSPPPVKGGQYSSIAHTNSFPEHIFNAQEIVNFEKSKTEHPKTHSNVVLTIQESNPQQCNRCPPSGPDLSHSDHSVGLESVKDGVGDFGQLPLSDSAHEASSVTVSHVSSSTEHPKINQQSHEATQVFVSKSIPVSEYLSSIEYPMQIIQAPLLDVPDLPKFVNLGYHSFNQHLFNQYHDSDKSSSQHKSVTTNANSIPSYPKQSRPNDNLHDATLILNDGTYREHGSDLNKNSTVYEAESAEVPTWNTVQSQSTPQPFIHQSSSTPKSRQVHQIIIPYVRDSPQARKVPPTSDPDLSAIYLNRAVTAPDDTQTTNINYPLTATGSENFESLHIPHVINSLPPDVMNKLLELGLSPQEPGKGNLKHVIADNIRAMLQGEEDTVDLARLQKNIDTWTVEGYGKRDTIPQLNSKVIPEDYFTTPAPEEGTKPRPEVEITQDHEMSASQHYPVTFKVQESKNVEDEGVLIHEMNGWSLAETKLKPTTEPSVTTKTWEKTAVSISPLTKEKVYVVTPLTTFPSSPDFTTRRAPLDRITRDTTPTSSTTKKDEVTTQASVTVTVEGPKVTSEVSKRNDIEEELAATVKYLGSAANLSKPKPT